MIGTIFGISLRTLLRDRVALVLTFVLPVAFFTVFASVFAAMDADSPQRVPVIVVADGGAGFAARLADRIEASEKLVVTRRQAAGRDAALEALRRGRTSVVLVLPPDLRPALTPSSGPAGVIEMHADRSNPLALGLVQGVIQSAAVAETVESLPTASADVSRGLVPVEVVDALGRTGKRPSVAFFAAGLGVMFLMFALTGRSAILLEEREHGVLGRLLAARIGLWRLLAGRWLFLVVLGVAEVTVMFAWAAVAFGLELFTPRHLAGFAVVTVAAAAAAAAFGLALAAACRTRAQLNGVAVVVILTLAAVGGNMFPSFLMPAGLQAVGRLTFNHWALVAYQKVFWYERPVAELLPQLALLAAAAAVFLAAAYLIADRAVRRHGGGP
jgi:ABC-2 type transport system permease protein